jgi:hypothetical protein
MDFIRYLKDGLRVLILDREASERLAADQDAFGAGLLIVLLAGLAQGIKTFVMGLKWWALILDPLFMLLVFVVAIFLVNLVAFLLGGKSSFIRLFRAASCGFVAGWVLLIPAPGILGLLPLLVMVWYLVALVVSVRWVHTLHPLRAFIAVAAPIVLVIVVVSFVVGLTVLGGFFRL